MIETTTGKNKLNVSKAFNMKINMERTYLIWNILCCVFYPFQIRW